MNDGYLGNERLKRTGTELQYTEEQAVELVRCIEDPVYFIKTYVKIVNVDKGLVPFDMWPFQEDMVNSFHNNRFSISKMPRQVGKTTTSVAFLLHYIIFNENVNVAILANKSATAREIMGRLQLAFEYLPRFLQQGVKEWNKGSIELAAASIELAASSTVFAVKGSIELAAASTELADS